MIKDILVVNVIIRQDIRDIRTQFTREKSFSEMSVTTKQRTVSGHTSSPNTTD